ncbi:uncharacterized protein A4U43_C10F3360 [Asparagus officinalis]|uniref:Uncharacterized protein n=1 Tax=Asparagus officinalis TaxID=4686 RepID=A0A5P1E3K5_ASPOF|nr:uncharacterized protein LOC109826046 [Asparagus officinalis]ONK56025.1 uncharacterized protein A4U43_C10F3360 [Asparagus officinalis]
MLVSPPFLFFPFCSLASLIKRISIFHMDSMTMDKAASDELARDSLIALSQSTPEEILSSNSSFAFVDDANLTEANDCNGAEDHRSELISLSYIQSPDCQPPQPKANDCNGAEDHRSE